MTELEKMTILWRENRAEWEKLSKLKKNEKILCNYYRIRSQRVPVG